MKNLCLHRSWYCVIPSSYACTEVGMGWYEGIMCAQELILCDTLKLRLHRGGYGLIWRNYVCTVVDIVWYSHVTLAQTLIWIDTFKVCLHRDMWRLRWAVVMNALMCLNKACKELDMERYAEIMFAQRLHDIGWYEGICLYRGSLALMLVM